MTKFHARDHNIECRERLFPFQPAHTPLAGQVQRTGILQHQPFVAAQRCLLEERFQLNALFEKHERSDAERRGPLDTFDHFLTFQKRLVHQIASFQRQDVEDH